MEVASSKYQTQSGATANTASVATSGATTLSSDFETFLKMLTAQMQNQDPLNPVDSTDFATQLATFSSVEQQVLTNDLLAGLSGQFATLGMAQMAPWVGMQARIDAPASFIGDPIEIVPQIETLADAAVLVVKNTTGDEVQRLPVDIGETSVLWDGQMPNGGVVASGQYVFEVESYLADTLLATHPAQIYAEISEVQSDSGAIVLVLQGGSKVSADAVTGLRQI